METEHTKEKNSSLSEKILEKIEKGEVKMRPKAYFAAKIAALIAVAALVFLTTLFLASFIIFDLRASHRLDLLGFGFAGIVAFFAAFPWFVLLVDIALFVLLEWLLRKFTIGYHKPVLYIVGTTAVVLVGLGVAVGLSPLHPFLLVKERAAPGPVMGGLYGEHHMSKPEDGIFAGTVTSTATSTFTMVGLVDDDPWSKKATTTVEAPQGFRPQEFLKPGDRVLVIGKQDDGRIEAYGVKRIAVTLMQIVSPPDGQPVKFRIEFE
ncbi:MAG TPA: hypothetical protein VHF05_00555 [Candidatus Paceibacterota bacterium]|nr:hypothetical protein [Candidatus Paceibacterota bacterium]